MQNLSCESEYIFTRIKHHIQVNGFALSFALKQRLGATWAYTQLARLP